MKKIIFAGLVLIGLVSNAQNAGLIHDNHAQIRKVRNFTAIKVSSAIDLYLTQANTCEVAVSASSDEYRDKIITEVDGGTLVIRIENNNGWFNWKSWGNTKARAYVSIKDLDALTVSGASNVKLINKIESPKLKIKLSGASDLKGDILSSNVTIETSGASDYRGQLDAKNIMLNGSGASRIELTGKVDDLSVELSGASDAKLYNLMAKGAIVHVSGASNANVNVSQLLKVEASGASNINYKGEASIKEISNTGASNIKHRN